MFRLNVNKIGRKQLGVFRQQNEGCDTSVTLFTQSKSRSYSIKLEKASSQKANATNLISPD